MDIRAIPFPADAKVISEPMTGFDGWILSIEDSDRVCSTTIHKADSPNAIANKLRRLAFEVDPT